jgi:hypothetical protein
VVARAQQGERVRRIGVLLPPAPAPSIRLQLKFLQKSLHDGLPQWTTRVHHSVTILLPRDRWQLHKCRIAGAGVERLKPLFWNINSPKQVIFSVKPEYGGARGFAKLAIDGGDLFGLTGFTGR